MRSLGEQTTCLVTPVGEGLLLLVDSRLFRLFYQLESGQIVELNAWMNGTTIEGGRL